MGQGRRDNQMEFSYKVVGWSILIFMAFILLSSLVRFIFY